MREKAQAVRAFDEDILLSQIGRENVWAISGGRVGVWKPDGECMEVELPVSSGYLVRIILAGDDTYTVERILRRRPKGQTSRVDKVLGRMEGIYCDQVGEVAYYASCYKSHPDFESLDARKYEEEANA